MDSKLRKLFEEILKKYEKSKSTNIYYMGSNYEYKELDKEIQEYKNEFENIINVETNKGLNIIELLLRPMLYYVTEITFNKCYLTDELRDRILWDDKEKEVGIIYLNNRKIRLICSDKIEKSKVFIYRVDKQLREEYNI